MKKTNGKILLILSIAIISATMLTSLQANAVSNVDIFNIEYSSKDIPTDKLEKIVKTVYGIYDGTGITSRSILCIFGHSIKTGSIQTTEHNYYATAPRCKETNARVEYCTRSNCDYFTITDQAVSRTGCH